MAKPAEQQVVASSAHNPVISVLTKDGIAATAAVRAVVALLVENTTFAVATQDTVKAGKAM